MKTNKHIQKEINDVLESGNLIKDVKLSPFFKDRVMQRINSQEALQVNTWSWFTPQFQLATLVGLVIVNIVAFTQLDTNDNSDSVDEFAQAYDLIETEEVSLFN